jgi:threonine/homoserine/homoserine lactone efflux protein
MTLATLFTFTLATLSQTLSIGPGVTLIIQICINKNAFDAMKSSIFNTAGRALRYCFNINSNISNSKHSTLFRVF